MQPPGSRPPEQPPSDFPAPPTSGQSMRYRKLPTTAERLASIAPTLKEAELRILLELATRAEGNPHHCVTISSRQLATVTRSTRPHLREALQALSARGLITTRQGTATSPSVHQVNLLDTVLLGGSRKDPPSASSRVPREPTLDLFGTHPGSIADPPPAENTGLPPHPSSVDIDVTTEGVLDRVLRASEKRTDPELLASARRWLHGYVVKLGTDPDRHPPDNHLVAQFLAIADWPRLEGLLYDLLAERRPPGYSYAWFISVALQRIHGIQPTLLKQRRARLSLVKAGQQRTPDPQFTQQLLTDVVAKVK